MTHQDQAPKYDILSPVFFADPYPTLRRMQDEDPAFWHPLLHAWVLTRYDDVVRVVRDSGAQFSAKRVEQFGLSAPPHVQAKFAVCNEFLGTWVAFLDPPQHTRLRAMVTKAFNVQAVERMRTGVQRPTDMLLAAARETGRLDIAADFAAKLPLYVFGELMGIPADETVGLKENVDKVVRLLGAGVATAELVEVGYDGVVALRDYFVSRIDARRRRPTEDLLSKLIDARVDGAGMSDDELVGMAVTLFLAGHDTTTHMITNAVLTLLRHPDVLRRLRAEPPLIDAAVEELLRFDGPSVGTFRRAAVDIDGFGGAKIAAGDFVYGMLIAANRDPRRFPEPDRFDLSRPDNNRHLAFSGGAHTCPGAALARLETRIAIRTLLQQFSDIQLDVADVEWVPHMMVRGVKALPVRVTPS